MTSNVPRNANVKNAPHKHLHTGLYPPVTYLLIDDLFVERMEGVHRVMCPAEKHPEPILKADKPWDGLYVLLHGSFLYDHDEKIFKLWYYRHDPDFAKRYPELGWTESYAYAVSTDCLNWEKPELGLVSWRGSRQNNLVKFPPFGGVGMAATFKNPTLTNAGQPYVGMGMSRFRTPRGKKHVYWDKENNRGVTNGLFVYDSPDGFTWRRRPRELVSNTIVTDNAFCHGYDEDLSKWIFWLQGRAFGKFGKFRSIGVSFAKDLEYLPYPQEILTPDAEDPPDCEFNHFASLKVPGGYVGLVTDFRPHEGCKKEPQLAFSRDARVWDRPAGRDPVISVGPRGSWDEMDIYVANPIAVGDHVYIIYHGCITGNGDYFFTGKKGKNAYVRVAKRPAALPDGRLNLPGIGMAKLKRDRWAAIEPARSSGFLHIRRMYWANRELRVNTDAQKGSIRAELRDTIGRPIPGFTFKESVPFRGDSLGHRMTWKNKRMLPAKMLGTPYAQGTVGRLISIHFHLERARLFSFSC